jgi:RNA polymerase sigma-70 factor (ECF subfamily)
MIQQTVSLPWLNRLRSKDHAAFAEFVIQYEPMVNACGRRLGLTEDEVEDVMGDTFLAAYRSVHNFNGLSSLGSWIWTIAYRQAINHLRKHTRHQRYQRSLSFAASYDERMQPEHPMEKQETLSRLKQAVKQLPKPWATAIRLFYWDAKSTVEIAQIMNVGAGVARAYLFRGRNRLRSLLGDG